MAAKGLIDEMWAEVEARRANHAHCWHVEGATGTPSKYVERCCHCAYIQAEREVTESPTGHGPFVPAWERFKAGA